MLKKQFLLVEPVSKTPYPPLGLMKISSMLKKKYKNCQVFEQAGDEVPFGLSEPDEIFITSLFTWDIDKVIKSVLDFRRKFPSSKINIGGIAASLLLDYVESKTGIKPHVGLLDDAENMSPDYSLTFGRKLKTSITFISRGCKRKCKFCQVTKLEPTYFLRKNWVNDINENYPLITFWDNNWFASPDFKNECNELIKLNKKIDFNQGLDARLFTKEKAEILSQIDIDPIRFAFDDISYEKKIINAITLAQNFFSKGKEIRVYVLYNFNDTPEDFFYRIKLLNNLEVLSFPMEYRDPEAIKQKLPGKHWNKALLRGLKMSLLFYYRKGMITKSKESFDKIYGKSFNEFKNKLYKIYEYDRSLKR